MEMQTPPENELGLENEPSFDLLSPLDDRPGPAQRISSRRAADMVQAALVADAVMVKRAAELRQVLRVAAVFAVILALGGAAAAYYRIAMHPTPDPALGPAPTGPALPAQSETPTVPQLAAPPRVEPAPSPAAAAPSLPAVIEKEPARTTSTATSRRTASAPKPATEPAAAVPVEDLLRLANEQRRGQHWREADALYQRVLRVHAHTPAAYVAGVASATLHLERLDDPRGALRLYQTALAAQPHGSLAAEARYGLADTYHALGDKAAEAQALRDFISEHADSPLRPRAAARLGKLSPP